VECERRAQRRLRHHRRLALQQHADLDEIERGYLPNPALQSFCTSPSPIILRLRELFRTWVFWQSITSLKFSV
jgi:hypothetical protein